MLIIERDVKKLENARGIYTQGKGLPGQRPWKSISIKRAMVLLEKGMTIQTSGKDAYLS